MFFSICIGNKNAEAIEFLGILNNFFSNIKKNIYIYFCLKKEMSCLIKKGIFIFYTIFKLSWRRSFTVLTADVCLLFSYFCCSYILVFKTRGIERILILLYQYKWQKFYKMDEKRNLGYQSVVAEYVTGQINSLLLRLLLRQFYRLIFVPSQKS